MNANNVPSKIRDEGKYWTNHRWAKLAHQELSYISPDWEKEYIVYDPCCGGGALLKGLNCEHSIETTLMQEDIEELGGDCDYSDYVRMRHDFLNVLDLPQPVDELISETDKPILFIMNPPYLTPGTPDQRITTVKRDTSATFTRAFMPSDFNYEAKQFYIQFIWRCVTIAEFYEREYKICVFAPAAYLMRPSYKKFRNWFFERVSFIRGFCFPSTEFDNIKTKWPVTVCIFDSKNPKPTDHFKMRFWDRSTDHTIEKLGVKSLYSLPKVKRASYPITSYQLGGKVKVPGMRTGFEFTHGKDGRMHKAALFNAAFPSLMPQYKTKLYLVSSGAAGNYGYDVYPSTFNDAVGAYTAIRVCKGNWINDKDELKLPDTTTDKYKQYVINALVYTMFDVQNNSTSMILKHELGDFRLHNHFFWSTRQQMRDKYPLLFGYEEDKTIQITNARYTNNDIPHAYKILTENSHLLFEESIEVLKSVDRLTELSIDCRLPNSKTQWHRWDASFYQLRQIFRLFPEYESVFSPALERLKTKINKAISELDYWSRNDWSHEH